MKGIVNVNWNIVSCPVTPPIRLPTRDRASQYWFSVQVANSNKAASTLEVSADGGNNWTRTERQSDNFFQHSGGFGSRNLDVKVTSSAGDMVVIKNVAVVAGVSHSDDIDQLRGSSETWKSIFLSIARISKATTSFILHIELSMKHCSPSIVIVSEWGVENGARVSIIDYRVDLAHPAPALEHSKVNTHFA